MRALHKLSSAKATNAAPGKYSDGGGLWFHKRPDVGAQWFLRLTEYGNRREMSPGPYPTVSLKDARVEADKWRAVVRQNKDPIKGRERQRGEAANAQFTPETVAEQAFEARKGDGVAVRWFTPLRLHVLPKLGRVPIDEINQKDVGNILAPIWHTKADTVRKAMYRASIIVR